LLVGADRSHARTCSKLKKKEELNFLLNHKKSMNKFIKINKKMN